MVEITLFEFHLDGSELTANAPFSAAESPDEDPGGLLPGGSDEDERGAADDGGRGLGPLPAIAVLVAVVVLFVVGRRLLGGEREPVPA